MKANNENSDDNTAMADGANGWRKTAQSRFDNFAQSRRDSWREAWQNTALAFLISILAHRYIVMPTLDWWAGAGNDRADWTAAIMVTLFYTALSLIRNYAIRRHHARKNYKQQTARQNAKH